MKIFKLVFLSCCSSALQCSHIEWELKISIVNYKTPLRNSELLIIFEVEKNKNKRFWFLFTRVHNQMQLNNFQLFCSEISIVFNKNPISIDIADCISKALFLLWVFEQNVQNWFTVRTQLFGPHFYKVTVSSAHSMSTLYQTYILAI